MMGDFDFNFEFVNSGAPIVTLSSLGIAFNTLSRSLLGNPYAINIGFDEDKMAIGIRSHNPNTNIKSYNFEKKERNGWVRIGCKDFSRYLSSVSGINFLDRAKQFIATYDKEKEMLIVIVDNEHLK